MSVLTRDRRGRAKRHRERPQEDGGRGWLQPHKERQGLPAPPELGGRPGTESPLGLQGGGEGWTSHLQSWEQVSFSFKPPVCGRSLRQPQDPSADPRLLPGGVSVLGTGASWPQIVPHAPGSRGLAHLSWWAEHWRLASLCDSL